MFRLLKQTIFFILSLALVVFSLAPTIYELRHQNDIRPERAFELVHNYYTDFNFYLSRIRQGLEGNLTVHEKYTSEPHQGSYIHIMYLAMGWVGRWVRVPWHRTSDIYHMGRIVLSMTLLLLFAEFGKHSFGHDTNEGITPKKLWWIVIAFLLAATASTYPILVHLDDGSLRLGGYMPWWSVMDSLQRITFIPHLLAGQSLIAFLLFALSNMKVMVKPFNWVFLGILGFVLGIIFPPGLVFVLATLGVFLFIEFIFSIQKVTPKNIVNWFFVHAIGRGIFIILSVPSLIYLQVMTSFFPWKELALADIKHPLPFKYPEYLQAMGIMLPLGLLGLIIVLKKKDRSFFPAVSWILSWIILLIVFNFIPQQSPLRFSEMVPHLPLGILAGYLFWQLAQTKLSKIPRFVTQILFTVLPVALIILNLVHMYSSYLWQRDFVDHKIRAMYPLVPTGSYVMYPLKDFVNAIRWIQDHTSRDTVIVSELTTGNYIPVYAGNTVYIGHDNTVSLDEKKMYVTSLYSQLMPADQAYKWLTDENLRYIFFGPEERDVSGGKELDQTYQFLEEVYKNDYVRIFHVK